MHDAVRKFVASHATTGPCVVLECGSRDVNGTVRDLFPGSTWVGVDPLPGPGADVVADFADYQHPEPVDFVVCTEVLEHSPRWADIIRGAASNLKPGGVFICTAATHGRSPHSAVDEQPIRPWEHYENIDQVELEQVLDESFASCEVRVVGLDVQAVAVR